MATPSDVLAQAARLRSGTRFERARAGATALSTFLQLSPDDKRTLAVQVAQRVAPELVPRIQAEAGIDLTAEQSRAVLDMVARLDGDDLRELSESMASPTARRATLGAVAGTAAAATGLDDVVTTGAGGPNATTAESDAVQRAGHAAAASYPDDQGMAASATLTGRIADLEARLAAADTRARTSEQSLEQARSDLVRAKQRVGAVEAELRDAATQADIARRAHDGEVDELRRQLRRSRREVEEAGGGSVSSAAISARPAPRVARTSAFTSQPSFDPGLDTVLDPSGTTDEPAASSLATRGSGALDAGVAAAGSINDLVEILAAGTNAAALRTIRAWLPRLASSSPGDRVRLLQAIPDGWARRRALQRMVEAGFTTAQDAFALQLLARTGDQVFAAGSMLDAGIDLATVGANLSPAAQQRLQRQVRTSPMV